MHVSRSVASATLTSAFFYVQYSNEVGNRCILRSIFAVARLHVIVDCLLDEGQVRATPPALIQQAVYDDMKTRYGKDTTLNIIPCGPAVSIVKYTQGVFKWFVFEAILTAPVRCASETDPKSSLQFRVAHSTPAATGMQQIIGFAHPWLEY
ncbi:hypothetical protein GQ600_11111 [Phytophthora cactorum]|nr:hypothetical protein GQ600_11111 [Phytophthora cactorum]